MPRRRTLVIGLGATMAALAAVAAVVRHGRGAMGHEVPGGIVMGDARAYDAGSWLLTGSLFRSIASNVAAVTPRGGRVLEVGCGPGRLAIRLARDHGLDVTGIDLDPTMIRRAQSNARRARIDSHVGPTFMVADVASLPFSDASFDVVVSTLSMHHWSVPTAGLAAIAGALRPGGRALIWDFRPGHRLLHGEMPDPAGHVAGSRLDLVSVTPWRWPWRFSLLERLELAPVLSKRLSER